MGIILPKLFFNKDEIIAVKEYSRKVAEEEETDNTDKNEGKVDLTLDRITWPWVGKSEKFNSWENKSCIF